MNIVCTKCQIEKPEEEFYWKDKTKGVRHKACKSCSSMSRNSKAHYEKYREEYKARTKARTEQLIKENREQLIHYLTDKCCVDCGEKRSIVLQFDHRDPTEKRLDIANMIWRFKWNKVVQEIEKCDVVCANCHTIRTAHQFGWYKINSLV
jgi:hypothetical protein